MRLKPATPLAIAYFISFALLLISTISAPIVPAIPIAQLTNDQHTITYGVFGWCDGPSNCTRPNISYDTDYGMPDQDQLSSSPNARNALSRILIVHPIAALFNLICFLMAFACHFRAPSHSPRYLMTLLVFSFPTLLITLLAFLVDILIYVKYVAWAGWLVLVATILVMCCSIFTCAMRRTLVSRKARKKRIAEDAHMNGTNAETLNGPSYQQDIAKDSSVARESQYIRAESPPPLDGSINRSHQFATYDSERSRPSTDDRTPLNQSHPGRDGSIRTTSTTAGRSQRSMTDPNRPPPLDTAMVGQYHNDGRVSPVSPVEFEGAHQQRTGPSPRGRGGPPPGYGGRGRGGYPPPRGGFGRGGPRGGPRGGYRGMPPPRGGGNQRPPPGWYAGGAAAAGAMGGAAAGTMMMGDRYHNGPPRYQDDYSSQARDPYANQQQYGYDNHGYEQLSPYGYDQTQPSYHSPTPPAPQQQPAYAQQYTAAGTAASAYPSQHNYSQPAYQSAPPPPPPEPTSTPPMQPSFNDQAVVYRGPLAGKRTPTASPSVEISRDPGSFGNAPPSQPRNPPYETGTMPPMANEPAPVGQAIEMDASPVVPAGHSTLPFNAAFDPERTSRPTTRDGPSGSTVAENSPHKRKGSPHANLMLGGLMGTDTSSTAPAPAPVELPSSNSAVGSANRPRKASDAYYEDVDPRFVNNSQGPASSSALHSQPAHTFALGHAHSPSAAAPEYVPPPSQQSSRPAGVPHDYPESSFYSAGSGSALAAPVAEDPMNRTRSPGAASDTSNFTSVSQRGVNPAWNPGYGLAGHPVPPPSQGYGPPPAANRGADQLVNANPDFALPTSRAGHLRGGSAGGSHHYPAM